MSKNSSEDRHNADSKKKRQPGKKKQQAPDISELEQRIGELTDLLQRERADSDNLRRHHEAQMQELKAYVKAEVVRELLPVIDNIDRALQHVPKDLEKSDYVKGVQGVAKQFDATLKKLGVERIKTVGEPFNPELHEAVSMDDSNGGDKEVVADELQSGFVLGDKVIRHAMVRVELKA